MNRAVTPTGFALVALLAVSHAFAQGVVSDEVVDGDRISSEATDAATDERVARELVRQAKARAIAKVKRAWWRPVAERGWLGVRLGSKDAAAAALSAYEMPADWIQVQNIVWVAEEWDGVGAFVQMVFPDSPAERAGLLPGDVITSFNGVRTSTAGVLVFVVQRVIIGRDASIGVLRDDEERELLVEVGLHPEDARRLEAEKAAERLESTAQTTDDQP